MRLVPIECVQEGAFLAKTIYDNEGRVLLREGVQLSEMFISRIKHIKILSIYIRDEYSDKIIEDVIKPEIRQKAIKTIKDTFFSFEKYNSYSVNNNINNNNPSKEKELIKEKQKYFASLSSIAQTIMDELVSKKNVMVNVVDIKSMDNYTYQHCVNVAILSLIIGLQLQLSKFELYSLCMGALLHDIGKVFIPKSIILKDNKLTPSEFQTIQQHSLKGYEYLRTTSEVTAPSRIIALQHHERENGEGYPEHRKGEEINKLAKIVAIADVYDALTSDRPYRRAMSPSDALEFIMAGAGTQFNYEMVKIFAKAVVPYPEGTIVKLSNDDLAVVEELNANYPLRPKIKIVKSNMIENEMKAVDLMEQLHLVIQGVQYDVPLSS